MTKITNKVWAVEVPDKVNDSKSFVECVKNDKADTDVGKFKFLFTTKTASEEDAMKVVEQLNNGVYHDYAYSHFDPCDEYAPCYLSALDSLHSLIRSKGLDPKNNYALIEKQSSDE